MSNFKCAAPWALLAVVGLTGSAWATNTTETEPNDSKATADPVVGMVTADTITGNSISAATTGLDYFRVKTAPAALGIYKHQLVITTSGTAGHTGTIRGLNQVGGVIGAIDSTVQSSVTTTTPARMNQWYGFGKEEEIYYRVTGAAATTADYVATLTTVPVVPVAGPVGVLPGPVVISTIGQTTSDTDIWLYDSNLNAIVDAGNDDESIAGGGTGATLQSRLVRTLAPGTYYLSISRYQGQNNLASPADDDFRAGFVVDFPNSQSCSSTTTPSDLDVSIGGTVVTINAIGAFAVEFVQFTVADAFGTSCVASTGVEGQNVAVRVNAHAGAGTTISSVVVNASSINPAATAVALSNLGGDLWGADVISTAVAGSYNFTYVATDSTSATLGGTCPMTVTATATGACCTAGECAISTSYACTLGGGTFAGAATNCGIPTYTSGAGTSTYASIAGTGTLLATISACDDCAEAVALPFTFDFYGAAHTSVGVSSNGLVVFGAPNAALGNAAIPTAAAPNSFAAALWDDLNPGVAGDVYSYFDAAANTFTISWENVTQFGVTDVNSLQVILDGDTNNIELVYGTLGVPGGAGDWSAGIEDATGSAASVNAGNPVSDTAVLITYVPGVNPCGPSCDSIDFNGDGLLPDTQDIDDLLSVFAGGVCAGQAPTDPPCNIDVDYNNDGLFPDTLDIEALLSVFAGGPCLV